MHLRESTQGQFQSTLRRTERLRYRSLSHRRLYFNPRSDERSDTVPIHKGDVSKDFNPRSDERSDSATHLALANFLHFNPRSDERSDIRLTDMPAVITISIHAPTNGATNYETYKHYVNIISIHAPTNGATDYVTKSGYLYQFQSTLRRTERLCISCIYT